MTKNNSHEGNMLISEVSEMPAIERELRDSAERKARDGRVEELLPRGLPLGVSSEEIYQEGGCVFDEGDTLVLYSDGLTDAQPELALDNMALAARLEGAVSAKEMVDRIAAMVPPGTPLPDDLTVLVLRKYGNQA